MRQSRLKSAAVAAAMAAAAAVAAVWWMKRPVGMYAALAARTEAARALAASLASGWSTTAPAASVVVIANPFAGLPGAPPEAAAFEAAALAGVRSVFGAARVQVALPGLTDQAAADPRSVEIPTPTTTPLSYMMPPEAFERLADEHRDCAALISLVGLPVGIERTAWWHSTNRPALAALLPDLRLLGSHAAVRQAFETERIAAAVVETRGFRAARAPVASSPSLAPAGFVVLHRTNVAVWIDAQ